MNWIKEHRLLAVIIILLSICISITGVILVERFASTGFESAPTPTQNTSSRNETIANPFPNNKKTVLTEAEILNYIHGMSHQKVKAEEKWVHYRMTNDRIEFLFQVIEQYDYKHEALYSDILTRWADGDFSRVDKDHNAIWNLQGGTIGKAIGILTPEEEQSYLKTNKESIK